MGGGEKELLGNVANTIRIVVVERTGLTDDGDNGARDQIPVRVQTQRYDRLNVEHFLGAVERPCVEIRIALERNTDEIGDRILRFLGEVFTFGRFSRMRSSCRRDLVGKATLKFVVCTELDHLKVAVQLEWRDGGRNPASQPNVIVFE